MASRVSDTTHEGTVHIDDAQFAILVNLLNKIAGNAPEAAHAAIATTTSRPTRPAPRPVPTPHHAPTTVLPKVEPTKPAPIPPAPGYVAPPPPTPKTVDQLSPAFGGPANPQPKPVPTPEPKPFGPDDRPF